MQNPQPSKQFRWVGQPSEEELLGIPPSAIRSAESRPASLRIVREPPGRPVLLAPFRAERRPARDVLAVLALGAVVMLLLEVAGTGLHFSGSAPGALETSDPARVVIDRRELASIPHAVQSSDRAAGRGSAGRRERTDDRESSAGAGNDDPKPPPPGGEEDPAEPLLQATVPGVGSVTVDEPEVPLTDTDLPETEDVLRETTTLLFP